MNHIIPTIFAKNKKEFTNGFNALLQVSKKLQIDFMDGKFVRAKSIKISQIPNLRKLTNSFEAHLMVKDPKSKISQLKKLGFKKIIFHLTSTENIDDTITEIKKHKLEPWIAINPEVPVEKTVPYLKKIKGILFMGVYPGEERQKFIPKVYTKLRTLKTLFPKIKSQVDGGANPVVIKKLAILGVDYVNSGSYVSKSSNPIDTIKELNTLF